MAPHVTKKKNDTNLKHLNDITLFLAICHMAPHVTKKKNDTNLKHLNNKLYFASKCLKARVFERIR